MPKIKFNKMELTKIVFQIKSDNTVRSIKHATLITFKIYCYLAQK